MYYWSLGCLGVWSQMGPDCHTLGCAGNVLLLWANEWGLFWDLIIPTQLILYFLHKFLFQASGLLCCNLFLRLQQADTTWQTLYGCFRWDFIIDSCQKGRGYSKYSFENLPVPTPKTKINGKAANLLAFIYMALKPQPVDSKLVGLPPQSSQHHYN